MPEVTDQTIADKVSLGPHQTVLEAEDESGAVQRFIAHRPTIREQLRIGVEVGLLTSSPTTAEGGKIVTPSPAPVGDIYLGLAEAVATLNTVIDKRPAGLPADVGEWLDANLTWNLFSAFGVWLDNFRVQLLPESGDDSGAAVPA